MNFRPQSHMAIFFFGPVSWRAAALYNGFDTIPGLSEQLVFPISGLFYGILAHKIIREKWGADQIAKSWLYSLLVVHLLFTGLWVFMILANFYLYNWMSTSLDYHWIENRIENCILLITDGNLYCRLKRSPKGTRFRVSSKRLSPEINILIQSPIQELIEPDVA